MNRHAHRMPFGAEVLEDGRVRFRLWAPALNRLAVRLGADEEGEALCMERLDDGWFELVTDRARTGTLYRYEADGGALVPDPASRFNPRGVHGPSQVVDPRAFGWRRDGWLGRPWEESVIYELHLGTFTREGTYLAAVERLDHLAELGVTAVELMPLSDAPGERNWGYDGVLPFAPGRRYGRPDELKELIQAAHLRGLMVFLDVVYNHFGPEGNYLSLYAPDFFTDKHKTPWGAAINFDGKRSRPVRDFFIQNALYWLEEYRFDGLRLDAVDTIRDGSEPHVLRELAEAVRAGPGMERHVHLVLENYDNTARYLERTGDGAPRLYTAQWNDDIHHVVHRLLTGETDGYYADFEENPVELLGRCLSEGFAYQGETSRFRDGYVRGEPSAGLPPAAFVSFIQNHDQVGNRAFGERLGALVKPEALEAAAALILLGPAPPLLFMGEEFWAAQPFLFFCDFGPDLARAVADGRRREFARFKRFADRRSRAEIPDPNAKATFERAKLDWTSLSDDPHRAWLRRYRDLLRLRRDEIVPRLKGMRGGSSGYRTHGDAGLEVRWTLGDGSTLCLLTNLSGEAVEGVEVPPGRRLYGEANGSLAPWSTTWVLEERT